MEGSKTKEKEARQTFTQPEYVPPPPSEVLRPKAVFDPNYVGFIGFLICGVQLYLMKETRELLMMKGVTLTVDISTTVLLLASLYTFTSNLEGWTRFPYVTVCFVCSALIGPMLTKIFVFDPFSVNDEIGVFYNVMLYGPLGYITLSTVFAVLNGWNETAHGFKTNYF